MCTSLGLEFKDFKGVQSIRIGFKGLVLNSIYYISANQLQIVDVSTGYLSRDRQINIRKETCKYVTA